MIADVRGASVEETRSRILAATREIYALRGSRGTTTREVAARAHVNEATLFRHFGTKGHLLAAMLDHYNDTSSLNEVLDGLTGHATLEEQLRVLGIAAIESMRRKEDLIKIAMAEEIADPHAQVCVWRAPTAAKESLVKYFGQKIEARELRGDSAWLARIFMSLFFSYVMARRLWSGIDAPQDEAVEMMVNMFLDGARAN
ncbi:MAG: TetR/AcrR family transcriptional regulator [Candidatus Eremiobacteraeota bacterium]|nr:TetR/AcrR family transcriptional regulator [Candidatus Eremiobacteraeota bacterium]MBC5802433.1 TetR/AcrR family transcriptional regulator [Candidatus Eremiobacteraeota bacterium]MBC5821622.1 TetR/AcrR family transcriptional regulator [Candidatus Eremiobacteraeota bacterium]